MDIKGLIVNRLEENGEVRASDIVRKTGLSRAYVNRFFQGLRNEGKITLLGKANSARYILATEKGLDAARKKIKRFHAILRNEGIEEDNVLDDIKRRSGIFLKLPLQVSRIVEYAFTEMLNNAIEHSQSEKIDVLMEKDNTHVRFHVDDEGMGIFKNITRKKKLTGIMEAIQDLLKGKQTTAPREHSGEGVFFTSKCADVLVIRSSRKKLIFDNIIKDIFIKDIKPVKGTKISFAIGIDSQKTLIGIFKEYTHPGTLDFHKTTVAVKLFKLGTDLISRSQARRILSGLERFRKIVLDFHEVETVGQGFADEVFRVWKQRYPGIEVFAENANENIIFMIERARMTKKSNSSGVE